MVNGMELIKRIAIIDTKHFWSSDSDIDLIQNIILKNDRLSELLNEHIQLCYSVGNFMPIPFIEKNSLNSAKGQLCYEEPHCKMGCKDFFYDGIYPYLMNYYNYFVNSDISTPFNSVLNNYADWLKKTYGTGKDGWSKFVEMNYLTSFTDKKNEPVKYYTITDKEPLEDIKDYIERINTSLRDRKNIIYKKLFKNEGRVSN